MADNERVKKPLPTGEQAGENAPEKSPKKSASKKGGKKGDKPKGKSFEENVIRDSETARERGRNGGIKSAEARQAKKDARESVQHFLGQMSKMETVKTNLRELGIEPENYTNMMALVGKLWSMAMAGNLDAHAMLMKLGGYDPEEIRKERESLASDRRRELELDAKVAALNRGGDPSGMSVNFPDEDGDNDVVIYMPQMDSEEDCQPKEDDPPAAEGSAE